MSYANAPLVLNSRDRTGGQYNSAKFNAEGQNIIQGNIKEIAVAEVNFPYDIPNMQDGYNFFFCESALQESLQIAIAPGFYTGTELAVAINAAIVIAAAAALPLPIPLTDVPDFAYNSTSNLFNVAAPVAPVTPANSIWYFSSPYTFYSVAAPRTRIGKDIFSIMGFLQEQGEQVNPALNWLVVDTNGGPGTPPAVTGAQSAPLAFTQYVDIWSPQLCGKQRFPGGSTTNLARRGDVICRLFICDNVSLTPVEVEGSRPFIINRQYFNARVMRWTTEDSIGTLDIQLYDDCGQPLTTTWQPRNYAITLNCYEQTEERTLLDVAAAGNTYIQSGGAYQERNVSAAWDQLSRQTVGKNPHKSAKQLQRER